MRSSGSVRRIFNLLFLAALIESTTARTSMAGDWPMWRGNAARSGSTPGELPDTMELSWVRQLPTREVAWPNEPRLQFDASYQPVVLGARLFVTSSVDGSLAAYDTRTGRELWRFTSDGPARLAPVAWRDRVYFGSDDGYLYCIDAKTGTLKWRVRGVPDDRPDQRQLGNNRIVSCWPVRSGPVIDRGVVCFAAGIWPTMGVFVRAVDARSGQTVWTNSAIDHVAGVRIDHNELDDVGLSPQGHALIVHDKLIVPNGRSMPARFDLRTGKLLYYVQGYRNGDSRVAAGGRFLFVGERGVVSLADGREVGNRWVEAGEQAPKRWDYGKRDLFEGPFWSYKFMRGCDYRSVFDGNLVFGVDRGVLYSYDLSRPRKTTYEQRVGNQTVRPARWELEPVWKPLRLASNRSEPAPGKSAGKSGIGVTHVSIKVGRRLYTHVDSELIAVEIPHDTGDQRSDRTGAATPRVVWRKALEGIPTSMLAADHRLFVVLDGKRLCCFGPPEERPGEVVEHRGKTESLRETGLPLARSVMRQAEVTGGFAVVFGLDQGDLVDGLLRESKLRVIVVDPDAAKLARLRRHWRACGVYGRRVEAIVGEWGAVRLPPYMASLVVRERPVAGPSESAQLANQIEANDLLHPYEGVALWRSKRSDVARSGTPMDAVPSARPTESLAWTAIRRNGGLKGASDWTHETGDAARSYYSPDRRVRAPLALLWYGDGPDHGFQKYKDYGRGVKPQVCRGRLFAFDDRGEQLTALDIYTGRVLWRYATSTSLVRFASLPDGVYVATGTGCAQLDPATGRIVRRLAWKLPKPTGKNPGIVAIRADGDLLLAGVGFDLPEGHSHPAIESGLWDAKVLVAVDRETGETRWTRVADERFNLHAIAVGPRAVYCVDSMAPMEADRLVRRGKAPEKFRSVLRALDRQTGKVLWTHEEQYKHRPMTGRGPLAIRPYDDWVAYHAPSDTVLAGKLHAVHALDAGTGKSRWSSRHAGMQPLILRPGSFINQAGHRFDLETGKRLSKEPLFRRTGGCNYTVGSENLLFLRSKCATYIDFKTSQQHSLRNLRSGCSNSLVAAGGLLNVPCFSTGCVCNYPLQTSFAMYHLPEAAHWTHATAQAATSRNAEDSK